jgi:ribosomal protein S12 methylthiotransferase accessory factor
MGTTSEIQVTFPGGLAVDARVGDHVVRTDQPVSAGGADAAPAPFDLFLASIATCAGIYALGYCRARGLSTEGLSVVQRTELDPTTKLPAKITLVLTPPTGFPEHHRVAIQRAMAGCKVKKTMAAAPEITVTLDASVASAAA